MTSPDGASPSGTIGIGGFAAKQALTEADAKSAMKGGVLGSFTNAQDAHVSEVKQPLAATQSVAVEATVFLSNHENRIILLESGGEVAEFTITATWTKPPGMAYHKAILIGAGGGGKGGRNLLNGGGGNGGGQGGWAEHVWADAALPATVSITIGGGGVGGAASGGSGANGTATSFGALLIAGGGPGNNPTRGSGNKTEFNASGGSGSDYGTSNAPDGGGGFQCLGGQGGSANQVGGTGGSPPIDKPGVGAGGGGGGGSEGATNAGKGGTGGFPGGGGGGGGGIASFFITSFTGAGGNGANGAAWIISSPGFLT